jgi:prephenate dehydrogenase
MQRAAVVGTGLIGTSIGIGLSVSGWQVTGWDPNVQHLEKAAEMGAMSRQASGLQDAIADVDLVFLASPPKVTVSLVTDLQTEALVTDVAGIKQPVVEAAYGLPRFVGGHPMAGREVAGPGGASGDLFRGATWVLTTDHSDAGDRATVARVVQSLGALPVEMTAANHDHVVALVSHLPMVLAATLIDQLGAAGSSANSMVAGGFRDLTRIALSSSDWWSDLLVANRQPVSSVLRQMSSGLRQWADHLEAGEREWASGLLQNARLRRMALAPPVEGVGVLLEDRPGEIAHVGQALAASGVDLRDLQLRHATHGGGGVLTLSVRSEEAASLRRALISEGFRLLEE